MKQQAKQNNKTNYWKVASIILGILVLFLIVYLMYEQQKEIKEQQTKTIKIFGVEIKQSDFNNYVKLTEQTGNVTSVSVTGDNSKGFIIYPLPEVKK